MISTVRLFVPGIPQQQGSKMPVARGSRILREANKKLPGWRQQVIAEASRVNLSIPPGMPVVLSVDFIYARPAAHYGSGRNAGKLKPNAAFYKTSDPDLDKLLRGLGDALQASGLIHNDAQIVATSNCRKRYVENGNERPGAAIRLRYDRDLGGNA